MCHDGSSGGYQSLRRLQHGVHVRQAAAGGLACCSEPPVHHHLTVRYSHLTCWSNVVQMLGAQVVQVTNDLQVSRSYSCTTQQVTTSPAAKDLQGICQNT